jgi:uncharacterized phiE125 gp8 family phage protein
MAIRLITPPAAEPITLTEAKAHLRVDHTDDDVLISALIQASRVYCEQFTGRAFITQTWEEVIDIFPVNEIMIPLPPLQSVTSIKYDDGGGVEQTLGLTEYEVDAVSQPGWVVPVTSGWPSSVWEGINSVRIRFVAGYAPGTNSPIDLAANVPQSLKAAILLHVGQLYDQREDIVVGTIVNKVPTGGIEHLLRQYRVALGMA